MKRFLLLLTSFWSIGLVQAQQPFAADTIRLSLEDCLNYAFGNSYSRRSVQLNEVAAEDTYQQSKQERYPSLSGSVSENFGHTKGNTSAWNGNYGVSANVTLYEGGAIKNTIAQNELILEQTEYETDQFDNELTVQILQSFLSALGNEELLKFQQSVVELSEQQMLQGRELYRVGQILESDYLLLEAQYASDRDNIVETTVNRDNSLLTLKSLLSMDPLQPVDIVYPDTTTLATMTIIPSQEYVLDRSIASLPDLKISRYNVEIAEKNVQLARSGFFPTLSLGGSVGTGHTFNFQQYGTQLSNQLNEQVGLTLSIPIYNRGRTRSNVTQNRIALQRAELNEKQTDLEIRQTVIQEYLNVISYLSKYESSRIKENAYWRTFEVYRSQFDVGSITAVDLLQQQNNYISALNDYIQSKYGFILRRKLLDVYMGIPITM